MSYFFLTNMTACHIIDLWLIRKSKYREEISMKYCVKCGKELFDEAVICPGCGCATAAMQQNNVKPAAPEIDHKQRSSVALAWAFLIPIIGIIMGAVNLGKCEDSSYRGKYVAAIIIGIIVQILCLAIVSELA